MRKILFVTFCIVVLIYIKKEQFSFLGLSNSLDQNEIALTFINDSLLMIHFENEQFLINLKNKVDNSIINKYQLNNIPIYVVAEKPNIDSVDIIYNNDLEFSFVYASKKFCVGKFYDCDFTYLYENDSYIDADVYFYNSNTIDLLDDIESTSYPIEPIISIIWSEKNYMIVNY